MKLSVPFIPDSKYIQFLTAHNNSLSSLYFPLDSGLPFDARIKLSGVPGTDIHCLTHHLKPLSGIKKYILMNTRFVTPSVYDDPVTLKQFLDTVLELDRAIGIQGIVIADLYLLNALSQTNHEMTGRLEAVPGVNAMLDSPEKVLSWMEMVHESRFALPQRIIVDRGLNRTPKALQSLYTQIKSGYPEIAVELLVNEGCLYQCPFKPAHDAHIALSNTGMVRECTWAINQRLGCHAYFSIHPWKFLKSPFIRPEDLQHYSKMADSIKICGRTLGPKFLMRCIRAYTAERFDGNLFSLMDTTEFLADRIQLSNTEIPHDFFYTMTTCTKDCRVCNMCFTLFDKIAKITPAPPNANQSIP